MLELCLQSALISLCLRATRLHTNRLWRHSVQPQSRSAQPKNFGPVSQDQINTFTNKYNCKKKGDRTLCALAVFIKIA